MIQGKDVWGGRLVERKLDKYQPRRFNAGWAEKPAVPPALPSLLRPARRWKRRAIGRGPSGTAVELLAAGSSSCARLARRAAHGWLVELRTAGSSSYARLAPIRRKPRRWEPGNPPLHVCRTAPPGGRGRPPLHVCRTAPPGGRGRPPHT